jgi:glycosyltransferase involved in cell wall biosynthesis
MLSILIPIYNYNAYPLVQELNKQCMESKIDFEILCQDDSSNDSLLENQKIKNFENASFFSNDCNLGRGNNINLLSQKAQFDYLLILDCDTFPKDNNFIKSYLKTIQKGKTTVVFGGIIYDTKKPQKEQLLRWVYGRKREATLLKQRIKNPYKNALTSNLLVGKNVFTKYPFDVDITKYGYEDLCFLNTLRSNEIALVHIENPTYHLNLESSLQFLSKTKIALQNLAFLVDSKKITSEDSRLFSAYETLREYRLASVFRFLFRKTENKLTTNLLSEKPSILIFDLFKLGYFCTIKSL